MSSPFAPNPPSGLITGRVRSAQYVYAVAYGLVGLIFGVGLVGLWRNPIRIDDAARIEVAAGDRLQDGIDPNEAAWYDLARLPGIGEILAKRIVDYRDAATQGAQAPTLRPFRTADDLQEVRGIGPKTVEKLRPHLWFPPESRASVTP